MRDSWTHLLFGVYKKLPRNESLETLFHISAREHLSEVCSLSLDGNCVNVDVHQMILCLTLLRAVHVLAEPKFDLSAMHKQWPMWITDEKSIVHQCFGESDSYKHRIYLSH